MFMYCPGTPPEHVQKYLAWVVTEAGQKIVEESGYVPLPKK
jgi:ABC-type phosphate transport system substrate-binding protein